MSDPKQSLPIEWGVRHADGSTQRVESSPVAQKHAKIIHGEDQVNRAFRALVERKGRECGNCRYFTAPGTPELQEIMVKSRALEVIENEAQIANKYALPLMQGLCHLDSWLATGKGGALHFTPADAYCDNHAPKNRLVSFLGKLSGR